MAMVIVVAMATAMAMAMALAMAIMALAMMALAIVVVMAMMAMMAMMASQRRSGNDGKLAGAEVRSGGETGLGQASKVWKTVLFAQCQIVPNTKTHSAKTVPYSIPYFCHSAKFIL